MSVSIQKHKGQHNNIHLYTFYLFEAFNSHSHLLFITFLIASFHLIVPMTGGTQPHVTPDLEDPMTSSAVHRPAHTGIFFEISKCQAWKHSPLILTFRRQRQADLCETTLVSLTSSRPVNITQQDSGSKINQSFFTGFLCVALSAVLELIQQIRLASNSQPPSSASQVLRLKALAFISWLIHSSQSFH